MSSSSPSPSNLLVADSFVQPYKSKRQPYKLANGAFFSFLAFLLISIFIYVFIFNLSLSTLLNSSNFWFFISNTLILIIAADYGVFSPSKHKLDFYEDYISKQNQTQVQNSSLTSLHLDENPKKITTPKQGRLVVVDEERENPEEKLQIVVVEGRDFLRPSSEDRSQQNKGWERIKIPASTYQRSKSEKAERTVSDERKRMMGRRSESVKYEAKGEENEFSKMTDEELNRRVEEFIKKFNRQMRLQAAANRRDQTKLQPNVSRLRD